MKKSKKYLIKVTPQYKKDDSKIKEYKNTEDLINVMNVYITDYIHRDTHMWSQNFKFFFASLIVMLLPYIKNAFEFEIPEELNLKCLFPILGIILDFLFLYNAILHAKRFKYISRTYNKMISQLPVELQRINFDNDITNETFIKKLRTYLIPCLMFLCLLILGIVLIIVEFNN